MAEDEDKRIDEHNAQVDKDNAEIETENTQNDLGNGALDEAGRQALKQLLSNLDGSRAKGIRQVFASLTPDWRVRQLERRVADIERHLGIHQK